MASRDENLTAATWRYGDALAYLDKVRTGFPPLMICVAINGGIQGKEYNSALPETAEEIAQSTYDAYCAGASMVHVHARDPQDVSRGARRTEDWANVIAAIRERCPDIIVNATTGGDLTMTMDERLCCLDAAPDVASLNVTPEMSRFRLKARPEPLAGARLAQEFDVCVPFTFGQIEYFAKEMKNRGIKPEFEVYHTGGSQVVREVISAGLADGPYLVQTVMGTQAASYPTVDNLAHLVRELPTETVWLASGIGPHQLPITLHAMLMGGHARVGLEDNVYRSRGQLFESNAEAVLRVSRLAGEINREIASPSTARSMLGLSPRSTSSDWGSRKSI